ncbi:hypothetical protein [Streptomyces ficellus]|uniref:Uncharacterized protein n=1 Tax=Streptomyces ficellus TaxID=1977088 RepID=A0A6I6FP63_9ACTN|nr:hypothetical protein [Streptomyces ficellus]QGV79448.1 hypothetical protein EIZ62_15235 [Streptomyces ficellus]
MTTSLEPPAVLDLGRLLEHTTRGLAYADERDGDRSIENVLLSRTDSETSYRRTAMEQLLCGLCSELPERTADGVLWLLPLPTGAPDDPRWDGWPEGVRTTEPPVCLQHATPPRAGVGHRVFYAAEAELVGVHGTLHPAPGVLAAPVDRMLRFDDPRMHWMLAHSYVRQLHRLTPANGQGRTR